MSIDILEGPQANATLTERILSCAHPGGAVIKLANKNLPCTLKEELHKKIRVRYLAKATELAFTPKRLKAAQEFLGTLRHLRENGGTFNRFYSVQIGPMNGNDSVPHLQSEYFLAMAMHFSMRNGPFGGELTFAVPSTESSLAQLENETQVFIHESNGLVGSAAVHYGVKGQVVARTFYDAHEPEAQYAGKIASELMRAPQRNEWRLPHTRPLPHMEELIGLSPIKNPLTYLQASLFQDFLPETLADQDREMRVAPRGS